MDLKRAKTVKIPKLPVNFSKTCLIIVDKPTSQDHRPVPLPKKMRQPFADILPARVLTPSRDSECTKRCGVPFESVPDEDDGGEHNGQPWKRQLEKSNNSFRPIFYRVSRICVSWSSSTQIT